MHLKQVSQVPQTNGSDFVAITDESIIMPTGHDELSFKTQQENHCLTTIKAGTNSCYSNPPQELDPYVYVVLTSL